MGENDLYRLKLVLVGEGEKAREKEQEKSVDVRLDFTNPFS